MCGRYTLSTVDGPEIAQRFSLISPPDEETLGRFNVCPTETIATVLQPNAAASVAWGLRPFRGQKFTPINVRSETAAQRFKWLMTGGRCLVLADPEAEAAWLSEDVGVEEALEFLVPLPSRRVSVAPANPAVNKAGVEGPELLVAPDEPLTPRSDTLF